VKIIINFPKGVTSWFMTACIEWNKAWWNLKKCNLVMPLNYTYNIINLMRILECGCVLFLNLLSREWKKVIN